MKSMTICIRIETDNAAFADSKASSEVARILRELADDIDGYSCFSVGYSNALRDIEGHEVGVCCVYNSDRMLIRNQPRKEQ